ncbi:hypothetical protein Pdca_68770 (plasmid) [Pseudonocardia autotrophica]|nr:hypothetical protein Pdca_68770 [Pseudonocardia autotrophica]
MAVSRAPATSRIDVVTPRSLPWIVGGWGRLAHMLATTTAPTPKGRRRADGAGRPHACGPSGRPAAWTVPWYAILALPVLFAAGMALCDTADGTFMARAYGQGVGKVR